MRLKHKQKGYIAVSNRFNIYGLGEIIVGFEGEGGMDSMNISDFDVEVDGMWKDMDQAFKDRDIIPNNSNTHFGVPQTYECKVRGWNP